MEGREGRGFMGLYRKKDMKRGQGPGKGKGQVALGKLPRKGRMGLKWRARLGMEKGSVREECPIGGKEGKKVIEKEEMTASEGKNSELRKGTVEDRRKG